MSLRWPSKRLADVADIRVSNVDKKVYDSEKPVKLCNYMDVYSNEYVDSRLDFMTGSATSAEIDRFGLNCGDVVITKDSETPDDIGIAAVIAEAIENLVCGYHLALIRPNASELDSVYLAKQLSTSRVSRHFALSASGSTRYSLSISAIESVSIPIPPKAEQTKIAKILSTLDRAIEQTDALIAKQERIKTGLMQDLLTRGIDKHGDLRSKPTHEFKDSQLGSIPAEWEIVHLNEVAQISSGLTLGKCYVGPSTIELPYLRVANVQDGYFDLSEVKSIRVRTSDVENFQLRAGDVLMNEGGDFDKLGRGSVWRGEITPCLHQNHVFKVRPKSLILSSDFLAAISSSPYGRAFFVRSSKQSTNLASINSTQLKSFPIPLPPYDEQLQIDRILKCQGASYEGLMREAAKLRSLKVATMQDLLTGKKRVTPLLEPQLTF